MRFAACSLALLAAACNEGVTCETRRGSAGDVCIPAQIAPDIPTAIELQELCGPNCGEPASSLPTCTAVFRNGAVLLELEQDYCSTDFSATCLNRGCRQAVFRCTLPALPAGDYTLSIPAGAPRPLHVAPGGDASCRFPTLSAGVQGG